MNLSCNITNVKLKKGYNSYEVNKILNKYGANVVLVGEDEFKGGRYNHKWKCECGNIFERTWSNMRKRNDIRCSCYKHMKQEEDYKNEVEKDGEYEYIKSYRRGELMPNGEVVKHSPHIEIRHRYCNNRYIILASSFYRGVRCSKCCGSYERSFQFKFPHMKDIIALNENKEIIDLHTIHSNSNKKFYIECPKCKKISSTMKRISDIAISNNYCCEYCGDRSRSIPEKFIYELLMLSGHQLEEQKVFTWAKNKRYDFYIKDINTIIEVHGEQHYKESFKGLTKRTLEDEISNDKYKHNIALKNGISDYIVVDARKTSRIWLEYNAKKSLNKIIKFNNVDFELIWKNVYDKNKIKKVCYMWELGYSVKSICSDVGISNTTLFKYLNIGKSIGISEYKKDQRKKECLNREVTKSMHKVVCLNTKRIFNSIKEAEDYYNICNISMCCSSKINYAGKDENGVKLIWMYYEDFIKMNNEEIESKINTVLNTKRKNRSTMVRCITTGEVFLSIKDAARKYGIKSCGNISSCCNGKRKTCGVSEIGDALTWEYSNV